jgi:hypothetical protein
MLTRQFLIVAALFGAVAYGEDITLPLDDGNLVLSVWFIQLNEAGNYWPRLAVQIQNNTSSPWKTLKLKLDICGLCNLKARQWTLPVSTGVGVGAIKEYHDTLLSLVGEVDGCKTEIVKAQLLFAESLNGQSFTFPDVPVDLSSELKEVRAKRDAEAAALAEEDRQASEKERKAAEAQAKKDADATSRRKQLAVEQKRRQAESDALDAKIKAENNAEAAEKQRKVRAACTEIYKNTIDKKVKDLTVREEQQVRACQGLSLYPPQ